jgi:hypothetical protein
MTTARQIYLGLLAALLLTLPVALRPPSATAGNCPADPACCVETNEVTCKSNDEISARILDSPDCACLMPPAPGTFHSSAEAFIVTKAVQHHRRWKIPASPSATCSDTTESNWDEPVDNALTSNWSIVGGNISSNGIGLIASITTTNVGTYTVTFNICSIGVCTTNVTLTTNFVVRSLSVTADPWLGIDLTDPKPQPPDTDVATASIEGPDCPGRGPSALNWTVTDKAIFDPNNSGSATGSPVTYKEVGAPSTAYQSDHLTVAANPPGCSVSTNFTVVKVDLTLSGVDELTEESAGGYVQFAEDPYPGYPSGKTPGACPMAGVGLTVLPTNLPPTEVITLEYEPDPFVQTVFVLENGVYRPAQTSYTMATLPHMFYIHGHDVSSVAHDRKFTAKHSTSQAKDRVCLTVFDVDLDIDSDNNNAVDPPPRTVHEDLIEEDGDTANPLGKIVFANHNDDDRDEIPDYSDLKVEPEVDTVLGAQDEGQFVPVVLQVRPAFLNWADAKVKISYAAEPDLPPVAAFSGQDVGNGFRDYRQVKLGAMRLWKVDHPYEQRSAAKYVKPDCDYAAAWFGLDSGDHKRQIFLEGINWGQYMMATLTVEIPGVLSGLDKVRVTVTEPNLGLNSTENLVNTDGIRVGVSDIEWIINDSDEIVEDQRGIDKRYGVNFWWGRDSTPEITKPGIVDLMPFSVTVPPELVAMGFTFYLKVDSALLRVYKAASPSSDRRFFLQDTSLRYHTTPTADAQIALWTTHVGVTPSPVLLPLVGGNNEFVFRAQGAGLQRTALTLLAREPYGADKVATDSCVLFLKPTTSFFEMWSAREESMDYAYPLDMQADGFYKAETTTRYGPAVNLSSPESGPDAPWDPMRKHCIVYVHGYNIADGYLGCDFDDGKAGGEAGETFRRLFWAGHRGNFVGFTWEGDEYGIGSATLFAQNVANAFQSAQSLRDLMADRLIGERGLSPNNIDLWAHSLGNQVAVDALRLNQIPGYGAPGTKLAGHYAMLESAIWQESFFRRRALAYSEPSSTITYTVDDLTRMSWAFFFNNSVGANPRQSVGQIVNSYNRHDYALWIMIGDDNFLRNGWGGNSHYDRPMPPNYWDNLGIEMQPRAACVWALPYAYDLAHSTPALLRMSHRHQLYGIHSIMSPAGQTDLPVFASSSVNAGANGWYRMAHGDHKGAKHKDFYDVLYDEQAYPNTVDFASFAAFILFDGDETGASLPQVWPWFMEMKGNRCFQEKE